MHQGLSRFWQRHAFGTQGFWVGIFAVLIVLTVFGVYQAVFYPPMMLGMGDPDRYYHLAISKQMVSQGLLRELPQVEDLGWQHYFPDKEFLFHLITALGYRIGGDWGALSVVPFLTLTILLSIYFGMIRVFRNRISPASSFWLVLSMTLLMPAFMFRCFLLRPHLLAILFSIWLVLACLLRSWRLAWLSNLGFALSYHAIYVPVSLILIFLIGSRVRRNSVHFKIAAAGVGGLLSGVLLNPYFPSNLVMGWTHLKIALSMGLSGLPQGEELNVRPFLENLGFMKVQAFFLVIGGLLLYFTKKSQKAYLARDQYHFIYLISLVFFVLSFFSPRASEYSVPFSIFLAGAILAVLFDSRHRAVFVGSILLMTLLLQAKTAFDFYKESMTIQFPASTPLVYGALARIPFSASGKKVFNCNWSMGSLILYYRPDLRFVDLLDPSFLFLRNPQLYLAREKLRMGQLENPAEVARKLFHADYLICEDPAVRDQLDQDGTVKNLGPKIPVGEFNFSTYDLAPAS